MPEQLKINFIVLENYTEPIITV